MGFVFDIFGWSHTSNSWQIWVERTEKFEFLRVENVFYEFFIEHSIMCDLKQQLIVEIDNCFVPNPLQFWKYFFHLAIPKNGKNV